MLWQQDWFTLRSYNTGVFGESYFLKVKDRVASHEINLYIVTVLEKILYNKYSRENLAIWNNRVENDFIMLPVVSENIPDFAYMETYIKAQQKLVIKNVVIWKDEILNVK